jgi:hypothetical protein
VPAPEVTRAAQVNSGGAAITLTTLNGNIIIRRPAPRQE